MGPFLDALNEKLGPHAVPISIAVGLGTVALAGVMMWRNGSFTAFFGSANRDLNYTDNRTIESSDTTRGKTEMKMDNCTFSGPVVMSAEKEVTMTQTVYHEVPSKQD